MTKTIRTFAALALAAASLVGGYSSARATTLKQMSVADLSRAAHTIVRAHCAAKFHSLGRRRNLDLHHVRRRGNLERNRPRTDHGSLARRQCRKQHPAYRDFHQERK